MSLRGMVPPDPQTAVSEECFAVVYVPRRSRKRFARGCVDVMDSAEAALAKAAQQDKCYAARVVGPSKSSEGQYIYYLLEWL